jgi:hypothetical protein
LPGERPWCGCEYFGWIASTGCKLLILFDFAA